MTRATRAHVKKHVQSRYKRTLSSVLRLKYPGDWFLKHPIKAAFKNMTTTTMTLCGEQLPFRQSALRHAIAHAASRGQIRRLTTLLKAVSDSNFHTHVGKICLTSMGPPCLTVLLRWMHHHLTTAQQEHVFLHVFRRGGVTAVKALVRFRMGLKVWRHAWTLALRSPRLTERTCMDLYRACHQEQRPDVHAFADAASVGYVACLKMLRTLYPQCPLPSFVLIRALQSPPCMRLLHAWGCPLCPALLNLTCRFGNIVTARLLVEDWNVPIENDDVVASVYSNDVAMLQFFQAHGVDLDKESLVLDAARAASLECLQWLLASFPRFKSHKTLRLVEEVLRPFNYSIVRDFITQLKTHLPPPRLQTNHRTHVVAQLLKDSGTTRTCNICFDDVNPSTCYMLPCGHMYHNACLAQCVQASCPDCRAPYTRVFQT